MILVPSWASLITRPRPLLKYFNIQILAWLLAWTGRNEQGCSETVKTVLDSVLRTSFTWRFLIWNQLVLPFWLAVRQDYVLDLHHFPVRLLMVLFKIYKNGDEGWQQKRFRFLMSATDDQSQTSGIYHEVSTSVIKIWKLSPWCHRSRFYISGFINCMALFESIKIWSFFLASHRNDTRSTSRF